MASTPSNPASPQGPSEITQPGEAAALLDATIRQLRNSRQRLEAQPTLAQGDQDALIYLETAEMHLRAARFRLGGAAGRLPRIGHAA